MAAPTNTSVEVGKTVIVYGLKCKTDVLPNRKLTREELEEYFCTFSNTAPNVAVYMVKVTGVMSRLFFGKVVGVHDATKISSNIQTAISWFKQHETTTREWEFDYEQIIDPDNCIYLGTDKPLLYETSFIPKYRF